MCKERDTVVVGWDGRSRPMIRYADELHLPDSQRSIVSQLLDQTDEERGIDPDAELKAGTR